jgi:hypothetical protein
MSEADQERVIGRAVLEYSEAKKALSLFRNEFQQLGKILQSIGESLQDEKSLERALHLVSNNPLKLVDAEKLRQFLVEFKETEAKFRASQKNLQSLGVAIE